MFKRADLFLALDSMHEEDGKVIARHDKDSWDDKACQRIGLNWETALLLQGMTVVESNGDKVGTIDAVEYDSSNGEAYHLLVSSSLGAKALVGQRRIPFTVIDKYIDLSLVMRSGAVIPDLEGGLASAAGKQAAVVGSAVRSTTESANEAVGNLIDKTGDGAEKLGYKAGQAIGGVKQRMSRSDDRTAAGEGAADSASTVSTDSTESLPVAGGKAVGRQLKRTSSMFKDFQDEYKKASKSQ